MLLKLTIPKHKGSPYSKLKDVKRVKTKGNKDNE